MVVVVDGVVVDVSVVSDAIVVVDGSNFKHVMVVVVA